MSTGFDYVFAFGLTLGILLGAMLGGTVVWLLFRGAKR